MIRCCKQGCDGSVLLDGSASGPVDSEKTAPPNLSLRGFDVIEDLRRRVHKECGAGSVSCADITAIVARDSIVLVKKLSSLHFYLFGFSCLVLKCTCITFASNMSIHVTC